MSSRREFLSWFLQGAGCAAITATVGCASRPAPGPVTPSLTRFPQGLASGDPAPDSVLLWTRVEPAPPTPGSSSARPIRLRCEVSPTPDFARLAAETTVPAGPDSDFTVRVFVDGLEPDRTYYYRFLTPEGASTETGRTRTAPDPASDRPVRFAWASCQSYEAGYYGAYRLLLNREETDPAAHALDFILHLGDFIYEKSSYGSARPLPPFPSGGGQVAGEDGRFAVTLDDYRHLYKTYLADPDLRAARARWPFIVTWDDHEFTNDCWQSMATYTREGEPSQPRKYAANRAWFEFIPARLSRSVPPVGDVPSEARDFTPAPAPLASAPFDAFDDANFSREPNNVAAIASLTIYRSLRWGRHLDLILTDTRSYRSDHCLPEPLNHRISGSNLYLSPVPLVRLLDAGRTAQGGHPPATLSLGGQEFPNPRAAAAPGTMLGAAQKAWFKETLARSTATWKIWGNSVPAMPLRLDLDQVREGATPVIFTIDTWEGYPLERQELFDFLAARQIPNFISLVGDHHCNFAGYLCQDFDAPSPRPIGAEFAVAGISSPSLFHALAAYVPPEDPFRPLVTFDARPHGGQDPAVNNLNLTFLHGTRAAMTAARTGDRAQALQAANPNHNRHLAYMDSSAYGIAVIALSPTQAEIELLSTEIPLTHRGPAGARLLRSARFTLPSWQPGQPASLPPPSLSGPPPFPLA